MAITIFPRTLDAWAAGGRRQRVKPEHPLARHLLAAWVFGENVKGTRDCVHDQDFLGGFLAAIPDSPGVCAAGPSHLNDRITSDGTNAIPASARLRRANNVSVFWYGVMQGDDNAFGSEAYILGLTYTGSFTSPYSAYGISRPASGSFTDVKFVWNDGGVAGSSTIANQIASTDYGGKPMSFSATFGADAVHGYKNGRQILSTTGIASISYGAGPTICIGCNSTDAFSPKTNISTVIALVFGCPLTATDHMLLAQNPFQVFTAPQPARRVSGVGAGGGGGGVPLARFIHHYKQMGIM